MGELLFLLVNPHSVKLNSFFSKSVYVRKRKEGNFYLKMHSTHFSYGYMASQKVNKKNLCHHYIGYSF